METISDFIKVIDPTRANIDIDSSLYDLEAINYATYAFTGNYHIITTRKEATSVTVAFELKSNICGRDVSEDIKDFVNAVIDHQVRLQLDKANGKIRELIVTHAFLPIDLHAEVKKL